MKKYTRERERGRETDRQSAENIHEREKDRQTDRLTVSQLITYMRERELKTYTRISNLFFFYPQSTSTVISK